MPVAAFLRSGYPCISPLQVEEKATRRMPRQARDNVAGAFYHTFNRGVCRQTVFFDDEDCRRFVRLLAAALKRFSIRLHAFCLMTNHYHLLLETLEADLSAFMHYLLGLYSQTTNDLHGREGPLFSGRFRSLKAEESSYVTNLVRYLHRNPVEAGIVRDPAQYQWSSHGCYVGLRSKPKWLTTELILGAFGSPHELAVRHFDQFVREPLEVEHGGRPTCPRELADRLLELCFRVFAVPENCLGLDGNTRQSLGIGAKERLDEVREAAAYLGRASCNTSLAAMGSVLGLSESGACRAADRAERRARSDAIYANILEGLRVTVGTWNSERS